MGKTAAYVVMAVLLGVVAMLPVIVFTPKRVDHGCYAPLSEDMRMQGDVEKLHLQEEFGLAAGPSGPFHIGLIIVVSFVFAFGVSFCFKRKMF